MLQIRVRGTMNRFCPAICQNRKPLTSAIQGSIWSAEICVWQSVVFILLPCLQSVCKGGSGSDQRKDLSSLVGHVRFSEGWPIGQTEEPLLGCSRVATASVEHSSLSSTQLRISGGLLAQIHWYQAFHLDRSAKTKRAICLLTHLRAFSQTRLGLIDLLWHR